MNIATIYSRAQDGIHAPLVTVEVHLSRGLPSFTIVGLPEATVKESKERVRSAILNNQFEFPVSRITINLAPADLPKEGGRFDLPIALGILMASGQLPCSQIDKYEVVGELSLTGELRPVRGALPVSLASQESGRTLILPNENKEEASLVSGNSCKPARHLLDVCAHFTEKQLLPEFQSDMSSSETAYRFDMNDIVGHEHAKRALEIAAAGGHNLLMVGHPGSGKTMLAERMLTIMPQLNQQQALESAAINSISHHGFCIEAWRQRPFRSPHHSASAIALVGGGSHPRPGEISLAHNGILFLDELPEFDRKVLEVLREPLESGRIIISRVARQVEYPARFQLIAAMNPCPCGFLGDANGRCRCTEDQINRYQNRISGPLLDRIDMVIEVNSTAELMISSKQHRKSESSADMRKRVVAAEQLQTKRQQKLNCHLSNKEIERFCDLQQSQRDLLLQATNKLGLSGRAVHRILKLARSIADLAKCEQIQTNHLSEAISYRRKISVAHT